MPTTQRGATPPGPPMRADAARNRERILAVAAAELARRPGAGLDDVARASGLARATVYRNFPNRDALLAAVIDRALQAVGDLLARARPTEDDAHSALRRLTEAAWSAGTQNMVLLSVLLSADRTLTDLATPGDVATIERLVHDLVRRGQREGDLRADVPASWLADQWFTLLQSSLTDPPGHGDVVELVLSMLYDGAAARRR